jgi:hypothetical protein
MDRAMLQEHLEAAERHIAQGREHIARQCELIDELEEAKADQPREGEPDPKSKLSS